MNTAHTEDIQWHGRPSHIELLGTYTLCFLFSWLIIPVFYAFWKWMEIQSTEYILTTQRLRVRHGVFNKVTDDLELYRVRDIRIHEPFVLRIFNLSNVVIISSDASTPYTQLTAISQGHQILNLVRKLTENARIRSGVREFL